MTGWGARVIAYFLVMCVMAVWMGYRYTRKQWSDSPGPTFAVIFWPLGLPILLLAYLVELGMDHKEQASVRAKVRAKALAVEQARTEKLLREEGLDL